MEAGQEATPEGRRRRGSLRAPLLLAAAALVVAGVAVAVLALTGGSGGQASPAQPTVMSAADRHAPAALVQAADAIGFKPSTEPGVGSIESSPVSAVHPDVIEGMLPVGARAPAFTLATPTGRSVSLSAMRGKAVLLEFFATWCPHCAAEAPHMAQVSRALSPARYAVVAVNGDSEDAASVFAFHRYFGLAFPALLDPGGDAGSFHRSGTPGRVSKAYGVRAFPTFYVVDARGRIAWRSVGEQPDAFFVQRLRLTGRHG
jgi:peroxiredoxin